MDRRRFVELLGFGAAAPLIPKDAPTDLGRTDLEEKLAELRDNLDTDDMPPQVTVEVRGRPGYIVSTTGDTFISKDASASYYYHSEPYDIIYRP